MKNMRWIPPVLIRIEHIKKSNFFCRNVGIKNVPSTALICPSVRLDHFLLAILILAEVAALLRFRSSG